MDSRETLIRIALLALLLYAVVCLASVSRELHAARAAEAALAEELAAARRESGRLSEKLASGWTEAELEDLARERLGLVLPGDLIFRFSQDSEASAAPSPSAQGRENVTETERITHGFGSRRHQGRESNRYYEVRRVRCA